MQFELREYTISEGRLDDFVREWREHVLPLRVAEGFSVVGPWVARENASFVWLLGYDGDLAAAEEAYGDRDFRDLVVGVRTTRLDTP
jgi:hypothetical protein